MKKLSQANLSHLAARWPSSLVAREKIGEFTGGIISPKTIANLDATGEGPNGRITVGRKVAYPVASLITWLESRANKMEGSHE